jgi:hypothetical protein
MSKSLFIKIWLWVIGLSLLFSVAVVSTLYYENIHSPCNPNHSGSVSFLAQRVYAQVPATSIDGLDSCFAYSIMSWKNLLVYISLIFLSVVFLCATLILLSEIIYSIFNKIKRNGVQSVWSNILIDLVIILITVIVFGVIVHYTAFNQAVMTL